MLFYLANVLDLLFGFPWCRTSLAPAVMHTLSCSPPGLAWSLRGAPDWYYPPLVRFLQDRRACGGSCQQGLLRELSLGPLAPEARIMPLDQAANCDFSILTHDSCRSCPRRVKPYTLIPGPKGPTNVCRSCTRRSCTKRGCSGNRARDLSHPKQESCH